MAKSQLTYSIREALLTGRAGGRSWHMYALSGGGGGSTRRSPTNFVNNIQHACTVTKGGSKEPGHVHGGPIPPGRYKILKPTKHRNLGYSAQLLAVDKDQLCTRGNDFFIHGRGPHGSDGCIVPMQRLRPLLDAISQDGGGVLFVIESSQGMMLA